MQKKIEFKNPNECKHTGTHTHRDIPLTICDPIACSMSQLLRQLFTMLVCMLIKVVLVGESKSTLPLRCVFVVFYFRIGFFFTKCFLKMCEFFFFRKSLFELKTIPIDF